MKKMNELNEESKTKFEEHIKDKIIPINGENYKYTDLYKGFRNKEINIKNTCFGIAGDNYLLKVEGDKFFLFAEKLFQLQLISIKDNQTKLIDKPICSSYEIINLLKDKKDKILYNDSKYDEEDFLFPLHRNKKELIFYYLDEDLTILDYNEKYILYNIQTEFNPKDLSKFFDLYFPYENKNKKLIYQYSEYREKLHYLLTQVFIRKSHKLFKFTGSSGIGKSFSLP